MNIKHLDWNNYHEYIGKLADKIKADNSSDQYRYIVGVDPDDMVLAVHLSHILKLRVITDINMFSVLLNFNEDYRQVLVVSNVVETGNSFNEIMAQYKIIFNTAVIFKDKKSNFKPTYYVEIPQDRIYFPWESCGLDI